ncbi:MAG: polyribonucleotide nucleotidyltransferase [Synergistaceae bacterium]|nr:polyribonucleotide nucleotidyltransferase [Synergistaceae bacterium]MBR0258590.1 polyribonucleotide nucleotidyltransferase [Synergistaceae bacterium]
MEQEKIYSVTIGEEPLVFKTGHVAKQANGAVIASHGDTVMLSTACMSDTARTGIDFFPLVVDYEERYYAAGKIPGGFIKREGKPADSAILGSRVADRAIRSLFADDMRNDVQIVNTVLAMDQVYPPNILGINAASAALSISGIPWGGPVGAVRIGLIGGNLVVNPTEKQMNSSMLNLIVAGHDDGITMVESGSYEVSEELLVDALELAHTEIKKIIALFKRMKEEIGKPELEIALPEKIPDIDNWICENLDGEIDQAVRIHEKKPREKKIDAAKESAKEHFSELIKEDPTKEEYISAFVDSRVKTIMRGIIINEHIRVDGRKMDQIRPITCEIDILPKVHGSAIFTRGETQSLATTTLGMIGEDDQIQDGIKLNEPAKRFILHYNFPPYSVGEVRAIRGPGRREIGHGALAERALLPVIPPEEDFPYVIRVVSDILESNGSSSQASICGGSLSMMHAGVPIRCHVAGIAMGLIKEGDKVQILTDIQGLEDHYGDMDFKVAGTRAGVTALQMDNKAGGITREILEKALGQARRARLQILEEMEAVIPVPNKISPNAPRIISFEIDPEKIRDVIGSGGKVVRSITQRTGVKMNIEDDGVITISGPTMAQVEDARAIVLSLTRELAAGEVYYGTVTRLLNFGVFVECLPGKEGLLHISEVSTARVPHVEDVFKPGDRVLVMVKEIDEQGRANLTRRRIMANEDKIRAAGLAHALPDERERDNLIASLSSRDRGHGSFSMRDRVGGTASSMRYIERGYSSNRSTRNDYDRDGRGRRDRRRDY